MRLELAPVPRLPMHLPASPNNSIMTCRGGSWHRAQIHCRPIATQVSKDELGHHQQIANQLQVTRGAVAGVFQCRVVQS